MHLFISLLLVAPYPKMHWVKKKKRQLSRDADVRWIISITHTVQSVLNSKRNLEFAES